MQMLEYNFMCAARCRGYSSIARRNAEQLIHNYYFTAYAQPGRNAEQLIHNYYFTAYAQRAYAISLLFFY